MTAAMHTTILPDVTDWLTVQEASEETGYHPEWLRKLIRKYQDATNAPFEFVKKGGIWLIEPNSLKAYAEDMKKRGKGKTTAVPDGERHEEQLAPVAEETTPSLETAPPAEPSRSLEEPTQTEEPIAQPATLSSVFTLKARIAALGHDQGSVEDADDGPDADAKGPS